MSSDLVDKLLAHTDAPGAAGGVESLDFLLDVPLSVTVELGRTRLPISAILALAKGSVIELDKVAGEPLDVRVNDHLIARGEAVVVQDRFGVRLTEIVRRKTSD